MVPMDRATSSVISRRQVEHVAKLARIELTDEEKQLFTEQLSTIIDYFRVLDEADTRNVPPMLSVLDLANVWRPDIPKPSLSVDEVLSNVHRKEKGFVKASKIV